MSPKRGERVAPPAVAGRWELRYATGQACTGWEDLCQQAPANTLDAWELLRSRPDTPAPTARNHRLKGRLAAGAHKGVEMEQWQLEVTAGGRIFYLVDRERQTLWIKWAGTGHPKITD